jgi:predicted ATPase
LKQKRIVITGGPGTGKTSIINELLLRKYTCLEEISRQITLEARAQGIEQLFLTKPLLFSELLLKGRETQFNEAATLSKNLIFLDRGIPDILAYMDYSGDEYPQFFNKSCKNNRYDKVFILAPWQGIYISDNERYEDFNQAIEIHHQLVNTYKKYDYELVDVPFNSVKKRTDHILNIVENN